MSASQYRESYGEWAGTGEAKGEGFFEGPSRTAGLWFMSRTLPGEQLRRIGADLKFYADRAGKFLAEGTMQGREVTRLVGENRQAIAGAVKTLEPAAQVLEDAGVLIGIGAPLSWGSQAVRRELTDAALPLENAASKGRATGARTFTGSDWDAAEAAYDVIRGTDDVATIAANTGMQPTSVSRIKDHLFKRTHQLDDGVARFDADPFIANAWQRMQSGTHTPNDMRLLQHELFESKFEGIFRTDYRTAHDAAIRSGRTWEWTP
jgi:hypothetical protein